MSSGVFNQFRLAPQKKVSSKHQNAQQVAEIPRNEGKPTSTNMITNGIAPPSLASMTEKRKRKRHKNSHHGCLNCKKRRIKCGEEPESCYNCTEKNLQCSFKNLPEADKQALRNRYAARSLGSDSSLVDVELEKEFQELMKNGYYFSVEKMSIKKANTPSYYHYPNEEALCSILDFERGSIINHWGVALSSQHSKKESNNYNNSHSGMCANNPKQQHDIEATINNLHISLKPLLGYVETPTSFKLYKVTRNQLQLDALHENVLLKASGEDSIVYAAQRRGLENWYQTFIDNCLISTISFHDDMALCGTIILNQKLRHLSQTKTTDNITVVLKKIILWHKVYGLKLAQEVIDNLHSPNMISNKDYLASAHNIIAYSISNAGISILNEKDYKSLLAFLSGAISTSLLKQLVQRFNQALAEERTKNSWTYQQYRFSGLFFPFLHSFLLKNETLLYVPSYNFNILKEYHDDLLEFKKTMAQHGLLENALSIEILELDTFLNDYIFENRELYESYDNTYFADFRPPTMYPIISHFLSIFSAKSTHIQDTYKSLGVTERIICLYWMTAASILDNIFPETIFLFNYKFSGAVRFCGFDINFINSILDDLKLQYQEYNPKLCDCLYRKTIYLTRVQSFFSYRWRIYDRNIQALQKYPDTPLFEKFRYLSRKLKFVDEVQMTSLKYDVVKFNNYPRNNSDFIDDSTELGLARPNHRKYVRFTDTNYHINVNVDDNYNIVKHQLNINKEQYIQFGIKNNANYVERHLKLQCMLRDEHFGKYYVSPENTHASTLSGFNINTFPLDLMKFSEYGLLVNLDFRPELKVANDGRVSSDGDFFQKNALTLSAISNDWNLLAKHSLGFSPEYASEN